MSFGDHNDKYCQMAFIGLYEEATNGADHVPAIGGKSRRP